MTDQPAPQAELRADTRFRTIFSGAARYRGRLNKTTIFDLSASGAKLNDIEAIPINAEVDLLIDRLGQFSEIRGIVMWRRNGKIGVRFQDSPDRLRRILAKLLPNRWTLDQKRGSEDA